MSKHFYFKLFSLVRQFYFKQFNLVHSLIVKTFLFQAIQFSQTVLFQTIQFCISTQFSSIWPIDRTLSSATTPGQSRPGSDANEGVLLILQSSSITGTSPSDCLVLYPGLTLRDGWGSYPSAEMQSVYPIRLGHWIVGILWVEKYSKKKPCCLYSYRLSYDACYWAQAMKTQKLA